MAYKNIVQVELNFWFSRLKLLSQFEIGFYPCKTLFLLGALWKTRWPPFMLIDFGNIYIIYIALTAFMLYEYHYLYKAMICVYNVSRLWTWHYSWRETCAPRWTTHSHKLCLRSAKTTNCPKPHPHSHNMWPPWCPPTLSPHPPWYTATFKKCLHSFYHHSLSLLFMIQCLTM